MDVDYLKDWAKRAARDLRCYADAAEESGCSQADTEALLSELPNAKFTGQL